MREIKCAVCGQAVMIANPRDGRTKYCQECAEAVKAEQRRASAKRHYAQKAALAAGRGKRSGKTLKEVSAEARAHGMTYGQWVSKMEAMK